MKIKVFIVALLLLPLVCPNIYSQSISGKVVNPKNEGIEYATIISKGSDNHAISDKEGSFSIHCPQDSGFVWVQFACLGYKEKKIKLYKGEKDIRIVLQEDISTLDEVLVRPSKYSRFSNYSAQTTKLNTFEIVTNPSALGDIIAGVKITPGVQSNDNDGRLIINGGANDESQIYIDGLIMFNPYTLSQKNVSVRSRLTPDLFSGVSLYAGGYSAQYGNALSGILQLNTLSSDELTSKVDLNLNTTGVEASLIHKGKKGAYRGNISYMNLTPYGKVVKDDYDWEKYYNQLSTNHYYEKKLKRNGYIKGSFYYSHSSVDYSYDNIDQLRFTNDLGEHNLLGSIVSSVKLADKWGFYSGANIAYNRFRGTDVSIKSDVVKDEKVNSHGKISLRYTNGPFSNNFGVENVYSSFHEQYTLDETYKLNYQDNLAACFNEFSWLVDNFNLNAGLRGEYSTYLKRFNWSPRVYMSYKPATNHIISFTVGRYFQQPSEDYLKYRNDLTFKESRIGALSYCYSKGSSKLQADVFYRNMMICQRLRKRGFITQIVRATVMALLKDSMYFCGKITKISSIGCRILMPMLI
jgi:hypothetical protein